MATYVDDNNCEPECTHLTCIPEFDDEDFNLTPNEVRKKWPRFFGTCPDCGEQVICYASIAHYIAGDW